MKFFSLEIFVKGFLFTCLVFFAGLLYGQQTKITDFIIFGGNGNCQTAGHWYNEDDGCVVKIGSKSRINGGIIGSYQLIKTGSYVNISSDVYTGGKIILDDRNNIGGRIAAGTLSSEKTAFFKAGKYLNVTGNVDVNGNIVIGEGSKIGGQVTHPAGTFYTGPSPSKGKITGTPDLPLLPQMPEITILPAHGKQSIYSSQSVSAGQYNDLKLQGGKTLSFSGTGTYVFNSIENRQANTFVFDFKNSKSGVFKLLIHEDADLGNISVKIINGGDASRIFTEVHGTGKTCWDKRSAWSIANGKSYGTKASSWQGTVWAPYGAISIGSESGSSTITGALISGTKVNIGCNVTVNFAPFFSCAIPDINAGPDMELNILNTIKLSGTSASRDVSFSWQGLNGGEISSGQNTAVAEVGRAGTYVLTGTAAAGCSASDTVLVSPKTKELIGSELSSLYESNDVNSPLSQSLFLIRDDSVYVEVIAIDGEYETVMQILQTGTYGMTDFITNGQSKLIITGKMPIANLTRLNELADVVNFCRPLYPPLTNTGVALTAGDSAMRTNFVRNSFGLQGEGISIGVLSDSYNTLPGNPAANDVVNGDLPGAANPVNQQPVSVIKEYPLGQRTDEGRAMLQIVHDIVPQAKLTFRTGFLTPGDFATGIRELAATGCNVIVDDVTFITEPFFKKGTIDSAVAEVSGAGIVYVTAAGNFASKSYGAVFQPVPAGGNLTGKAHDFGGGDILQSDSLKGTAANPGVYTIVLQWVDDIYSLSGSGTMNDLDIYLADDDGNPIVGYNRDNTNGDPLEVLPFTVTSNTVANIMIINNSQNPSPNLRFKYVVFRGDLKINEYSSESSTIVGHGNAPEAITVGAARYSKTPAFQVSVPELESFSSTGGGILSNGTVSQKPDIVGPDGVNTSVNFGNVDSEGDELPNFFGTSAGAPHVAGAVALLLQAGQKYYGQLLTPESVKNTFLTTAIDMDTPGFDFNTGHGFIQADAALRTVANPVPQIDSLEFTDPTITPGTQPTTVLIHGHYFSSDTKIIFGTDTLPASIISTSLANVTLPVFYSNKLITAYSPSITPSALDGGISNSIALNGIPKKNITITANNQTKKFGTVLPVFTSTILVDGDSLQNTNLTAADLGLTDILYQTPADQLSDVGIYFIRPSRPFNEQEPAEQALLDRFNYSFIDGALTISKLALKITARDTTLIYGQKAGDFNFNYLFDPSANLADPSALLQTVKGEHKDQSAQDVIGLVNGQAVVIVNGQAVQIVNGQAVQIVNGQAVVIVNGQAIQIVNGQAIQIVNGQAVQIVNNLTAEQVDDLNFLATASTLQHARQLQSSYLQNGQQVPQKTNVVDITQESILKFNANSAQTSLVNSISNVDPRGLVDIISYTNGQAIQIVNGQAVQIVNGQAIQIVNGQAVQIVNGQAVVIVNGESVPIVSGGNRTALIINQEDVGKGISEYKSVNLVTGLDAGEQFIIPATFSEINFDISYAPGKLTILPAPLTIKISDTTKSYGTEIVPDVKGFSVTNGGLMYGDSILNLNLNSTGTAAAASPGKHDIKPGDIVFNKTGISTNYNITVINGTLTVGKATVLVKANDATRKYGQENPEFTANISGLLNGDTPDDIDGVPAFETSATRFSNVGKYDIAPSAGTLQSDKYAFTFEKGLLTITPAPLEVKADDKVMFANGPLPRFTSSVSGGIRESDFRISYKVEPTYRGKAGVYQIIPRAELSAASQNYIITYSNGNLYVNPKCGNAESLQVRLKCVEKTANGKYIAHFECINKNKTTVYIPAGWNNFIYSFGRFDARSIPHIFSPGITTFDVPFDGNPITWVVSSYERCWFVPSLAIANFWSQTCGKSKANANSRSTAENLSKGMTGGEMSAIQREKAGPEESMSPQNEHKGVLKVYPNPVQNKAVVYLSDGEISAKNTTLLHVNGRKYPLKIVRQITPNSFEIDMSGLIKGFYLIKVKVADGFKSIIIIKE